MESKILINYFERVVGTPMEMPYFEMVIYAYSDIQVMAEVIRDGGTEEETSTKYLVSKEVVDEAYKIIDEYRMKEWYKESYPGVEGKFYAIKFLDGEKLIRVTSENVPEENGMKGIYTMCGLLQRYIEKGERITESEGKE